MNPSLKTVSDLLNCIDNTKQDNMQLDYSKFPAIKTRKIEKETLKMMRKMRTLYNIEVSGLDNIPNDTNFIISSNHASYLDPVWILSALGDEFVLNQKYACLAVIHTMKTKKIFEILNCIPVDRDGNTHPAMRRVDILLKEGYNMIIFPEGARSRDGSMLPFKQGVSKLSIDNNVPIIPVRINGGFEIFPRHIKKPRRKDDNNEKFKLEIIIGSPIWPQMMDVSELTDKLRTAILQLRRE